MSDDYGIGALFSILFIAIPFAILGIWKVVDIVIWIIKNVSIGVG